MTLAAITESLDRELRPLAFGRRKLTWNRQIGSFVDVLELQEGRLDGTVTINLGVVHAGIYELLWGRPIPALVAEHQCIVGTRIGELVDKKDRWWPVGDSNSVDEISSVVRTNAHLFFDRLHARAAMRQWLLDAGVLKQRYPKPIIYLAILENSLGRSDRSCEILESLRNASIGNWSSKVMEVAKRLDCRTRSN